VIRKALRNASIERPGKLQNAVEMILGGLRNFFLDILGKENERYVPFVGTLWLFILVNNLAGIVPGLQGAEFLDSNSPLAWDLHVLLRPL